LDCQSAEALKRIRVFSKASETVLGVFFFSLILSAALLAFFLACCVILRRYTNEGNEANQAEGEEMELQQIHPGNLPNGRIPGEFG